MVKNPGEASGAGPVRALNLPAPVDVEEDESRRPVAILVGTESERPASAGRSRGRADNPEDGRGPVRRRRLRVVAIVDRWEITDEWWRPQQVHRAYYRVTTEDGAAATLFHDLTNGGWYRQRDRPHIDRPPKCSPDL